MNHNEPVRKITGLIIFLLISNFNQTLFSFGGSKNDANKENSIESYIEALTLLVALVGLLGDEEPKPIDVETRQELAQKVKDEFWHSWTSYKKYAWGHDELKPLSKSYHDWYEKPLMISLIDALDTLWIMGFEEEARQAEKYVTDNLSFDIPVTVQVFEVNIRVLGGLLSAYKFSKNEKLLQLAEDLGERLLAAFESSTGIPYPFVNLKTGEKKGATSNPAEAGSYILEFGMLSHFTGKQKYYQAAKRAQKAIFSRRFEDGLVSTDIEIDTGRWTSEQKHLGGGIDSYVEYLLKGSVQFGDPDYQQMWNETLSSLKRELIKKSINGLMLHSKEKGAVEPVARSLEIFFPGLLVLSGEVSMAREMLDTYYKIWTTYKGVPESLITGLIFSKGYWAYPLRPEVMESIFYLYQATHESKYQEMATEIFRNIQTYYRVENGYVGVVDLKEKSKKIDKMDSYFLSETLKYLYLVFSEKGSDLFRDYTFSTEGHVFSKALECMR